jgi:GNAT superfamily N-acetyltransferase
MAFTIRRATKEDAGAILGLVRELAHYERSLHEVVATEEDYLRDGFGADPRFHVLLACDAATREAIGFAFYFFGYSTWEGRGYLHLEDLFVKERRRKEGIGLALMRALAAEAKGADCTRFVWNVLDWNQPSIEFYERLGAKILGEWRVVRADKKVIAELAGAATVTSRA